MIRILAIDPGLSCGWALYQKGVGAESMVSGVWNLSGPGGDGLRFVRLADHMKHQLVVLTSAKGGAVVAYEDVRRHLGTLAAHVYGGIIATVQSTCETFEVPYIGIPVGTVKKLATGSGRASKEQMLLACAKRWAGSRVTDHNEADARFIALAAARVGQ
jgi:crossover junction endodeoxyribonuclease RuvC